MGIAELEKYTDSFTWKQPLFGEWNHEWNPLSHQHLSWFSSPKINTLLRRHVMEKELQTSHYVNELSENHVQLHENS